MRLASLTLFDLSIPLRMAFRHSLAKRERSRNLVVRAELDNGCCGYGEGVPVGYVTGETIDSARAAICEHHFPAVRNRNFSSYEEVGKWLCELPPASAMEVGNAKREEKIEAVDICHTSAKCAFELALLDAFGHAFEQPIADLASLVPLPPLGERPARHPVFGVALTANREWIQRKIGLLKLYGFCDFKLKIGTDAAADRDNVELVVRRLGRRLARGTATLRVDDNAAYPDAEHAFKALEPLVRLGVECIEQPLPGRGVGQASSLSQLAKRLGVPMFLDESIRTLEDAQQQLVAGDRIGVNIRLSKNGGFFDSLRLAALCRERGAPFQLGCHVGETGILATAQVHLAALLPDARYLEGAFGTHLLEQDIARADGAWGRRRVRFGFRGRPPRLGDTGLGIAVDEAALRKYLLSSERAT